MPPHPRVLSPEPDRLPPACSAASTLSHPPSTAAAEMFQPRRTSFLYEMEGGGLDVLPTTLHRAKEDCPKVHRDVVSDLAHAGCQARVADGLRDAWPAVDADRGDDCAPHARRCHPGSPRVLDPCPCHPAPRSGMHAHPGPDRPRPPPTR